MNEAHGKMGLGPVANGVPNSNAGQAIPEHETSSGHTDVRAGQPFAETKMNGYPEGSNNQVPEEYLNGNLKPAAIPHPASHSQTSISDIAQPHPQKEVTEPQGVKTEISEKARQEGKGLMPPAPLPVFPEAGEEARMEPHLQLM